MRLFQAGHGEALKGQVHVALGALALVCAAYNLIAFTMRRERHLGVNAVVYGALAAYEARQIARHLEAA